MKHSEMFFFVICPAFVSKFVNKKLIKLNEVKRVERKKLNLKEKKCCTLVFRKFVLFVAQMIIKNN